METVVKVALPLPLDVASSLMRAVGTVYPSTQISQTSGGFLEFHVSDEDRRDPQEPSAETVYAPSDADLEAVLTDLRDGSLGVSVPEWFTKMVLGGVLEVFAEHPEALNYLEMPLHAPDGATYVVIACRSREQTPHALRRLAEERADRYAAKLRELGVDPDAL